jgi:SAM-dependent MidA family methyltransferase
MTSSVCLPAPAPEDLDRSTTLLSAIAGQIQSRGGWLSFADYMNLALYMPGLGYYAAASAKFGEHGDFITAPGISPLFGRTLASSFIPVLQESGGGILELGAGDGLLASQILAEFAQRGMRLPVYRILDVSGNLRARQQARLQPLIDSGADIAWLDALPEHWRGVIFGNEVLDALPAHLLEWQAGGVMELGVVMQAGELAWSARPLTHPALQARAAQLKLPPAYRTEICLAAPALISSLAERLDKGALLMIDYGFGRREYTHPQRHMGTLRAHYRHHALDDPFYLPGLCDLTTHVDFTAIADTGLDAGLELAGYCTQASYLLGAGITQCLESAGKASPGDYLRLSNGVQKLLSTAEMGELFKVIGFTRNCAAPLAGFSLHSAVHRL